MFHTKRIFSHILVGNFFSIHIKQVRRSKQTCSVFSSNLVKSQDMSDIIVALCCLNAILQVNAFPITIMFGMCSIFLFMASILQRRLMVVAEIHRSSKLNKLLLYSRTHMISFNSIV